jgi:hypothetical protein
MPTSTSRYRFEFRLFDWAETFIRSLSGTRCAFFVGLRADGTIRRIYVSPPDDPFDGERKAKLAEAYTGWFVYAPYEEPGTGYLEWLGLEQAVAERWLAARLGADDYFDVRSTSAREGWPESWRVIIA